MTVDGHILGERFHYPEMKDFFDAVMSCSDNIMIYATDYQQAVELIKNFEY